jgi:antitoxin ParD1/3/4
MGDGGLAVGGVTATPSVRAKCVGEATRPNWVGLNPTEAASMAMRSTQQFSITLPNEMAEAVRAKVASGEYATESEVIRDGLRVLLARDRAVEAWLRKDVAAAYDALKADPARAVGVGEVKTRLAAVHKKASART